MLSFIYSIQKPHPQSIYSWEKFDIFTKMVFDNYMVLIPGRFYCMIFVLSTTINEFVLEARSIASSAEERTVLGLTIDFRSAFYSSLKRFRKKNWEKELRKKKNKTIWQESLHMLAITKVNSYTSPGEFCYSHKYGSFPPGDQIILKANCKN